MVDEEALKPIREVLEHVRDWIDYVVHCLGKIEEVRSLAWRCRSCGYIKHFTRPMPSEVAPPCPKCRGGQFERVVS